MIIQCILIADMMYKWHTMITGRHTLTQKVVDFKAKMMLGWLKMMLVPCKNGA